MLQNRGNDRKRSSPKRFRSLGYFPGNSIGAIPSKIAAAPFKDVRTSARTTPSEGLMTHRSNQAVASQGRPPPRAPELPPPPRRFLIGWATAVAALGASIVLLVLGLWLMRMPLAAFFIDAALSERGAEADFRVVNLGLNVVTLENVRFGAAASPDASISRVEARWRWRGLSPHSIGVRLLEPRVRLRIDRAGNVSAGALDRVSGGPPGARRPSLPHFNLEIVDGEARIEAPFGVLEAPFHGAGVLGENFSGVVHIAETSHQGAAFALDHGRAELVVASRNDDVTFRLDSTARALTWGGAQIGAASLRLVGRAPMDLARIDVEGAGTLETLRARALSATQIAGVVRLNALTRPDALAVADWRAHVQVGATSLTHADMAAQRPRLEAHLSGSGAQGGGDWTLAGDRFAGLALISNQPAATGRLHLDEHRNLSGDASLTFARTALDARAQRGLREAFPDFGADMPIGPTFARAERALDRAADSFTLTVPVLITGGDSGVRLTMVAPAEARAATGALLRLSPLRQDAPALVLLWPGPAMHGGVALELSGGGAPNAALLLDTLAWSQGAPFDADGTLTLANWRAPGASIDANELGVTVTVQPRGGGRIDLQGPVRISGPLGDGRVRNLAPTLDLNVTWGGGW